MKLRLLLALLLLPFLPLTAQEDKSYIVLGEESIHKGDYFAAGGSIEITGVVLGDVYVFGSQVHIDGRVEGDVISSAGTIEISGEVTGNVRLAGGQIEIDGVIGKNVTAMGGNIQLSNSSRIGGSIALAGGMINIEGVVRKGGNITASSLRVSGQIGRDLKANVGQLRLSPRARIGGKLEYTSTKEAIIDAGAEVREGIAYHPSLAKEVIKGRWKTGVVTVSRYAGLLMNLIFSFVIGWLLLRFGRQRLHGAMHAIRTSPIKSFFVGLFTLILLPLVALLLFITILGFPIGLALIAISVLGFYSAKVVTVFWASNALFSRVGFKRDSLWAFLIGLIIFFLVTRIPTVGGIVSLVATFLGLGAFLTRQKPSKKKEKRA